MDQSSCRTVTNCKLSTIQCHTGCDPRPSRFCAALLERPLHDSVLRLGLTALLCATFTNRSANSVDVPSHENRAARFGPFSRNDDIRALSYQSSSMQWAKEVALPSRRDNGYIAHYLLYGWFRQDHKWRATCNSL